MPDDKGRLTPADRETIARWLGTRQAMTQCPSCGKTDWELGEYLAQLPAFGRSYPSVVLLCRVCAFTRLHNAVKIGVVKPDQPQLSVAQKEAGNG